MISVIRKYQKSLMLIVALLTIIAFAFLYNPADPTELDGNVAARVYGKTYTQADVDRIVRGYQLALSLGELDLLQALGATAADQDRAVSDYIWNIIVLRHEANALSIEPADSQVAEKIRGMAPFQNNGVFDPARYEAFVTEQLGPRGLTPFSLEEVARDALRLGRLKAIVGAAAAVAPGEAARAMRVFQPSDVKVFRFPLDLETTVPEEEVKAYFERNQELFVAPEKVSIEAAKFTLPESAGELEGRARVAALQEVARAAAEFAEREKGPGDFAAEAGTVGAEVLTAGPFARGATDAGIPPAVVGQAFLLPEESATSEVVQVGEEFYVFRVTERVPERPLTFEEAAPTAQARLVQLQANRDAAENAAQSIASLRAGLARGESVADAATAAGLQGEDYLGLDPANPNLPPDLMPALRAIPILEPGQVSNFIPTGEGGLAVAVLSRAGEAEELPQREAMESRLLENRRDLLFASWLNFAREASGLVLPSRPR